MPEPMTEARQRKVNWEYALAAGVGVIVCAVIFWPRGTGSSGAPPTGTSPTSFAQEVERGLAALNAADNAGAVGHFTAAVALDPSSPIGYLDLGIALLRSGKYIEAIPVCQRAVALAPANPDARHNLGYAYRMIDQPDRAIELLAAVASEHGDRAVTWYELGMAQLAVGSKDDARASFERVLALAPDHVPARQRLAELTGSG
jgi:Flp pilus assembly protein TadD